jgi:hypothetical protein
MTVMVFLFVFFCPNFVLAADPPKQGGLCDHEWLFELNTLKFLYKVHTTRVMIVEPYMDHEKICVYVGHWIPLNGDELDTYPTNYIQYVEMVPGRFMWSEPHVLHNTTLAEAYFFKGKWFFLFQNGELLVFNTKTEKIQHRRLKGLQAWGAPG